MLVLYPIWAILALVYFAAARVTFGKLKWREAGALTSLTAWLLFVLLMLCIGSRLDAIYALLMLLFLTWRHNTNLRRMLGNGEPARLKEQASLRSSP